MASGQVMDKVVSESIVISAPAADIFELLATPAKHKDFDGSATVKGMLSGPDRLFLGAKFGMSMKMGVPYRITNEVIEFEDGKSIAWRHIGKHEWRYSLEALEPGVTRVTEYFDYTRSRSPLMLELMRAPKRNRVAIETTLKNLKSYFENK